MSNLAKIKSKLKQAELVAVTKNVTVEQLLELYEEGQRDFGENRVQELIRKEGEITVPLNWHFIGPLQRNKVKKLLQVKNLKYIHSIDSLKLIDELIKQKDECIGEGPGLFLEYNTSGEEEKHGFNSYGELLLASKKIQEKLSPKMNLIGLMTIGKIRTDNFVQEAKESFSTLRDLKEKLEKESNIDSLKLSMGMSSDFELAIESGSDFVRIGRALFV